MSVESNERLSKITRNIALAAGAVALIVSGVELVTDAIPDKAFIPIEIATIATGIELASFSNSAARWAVADQAIHTGRQG